MTEVQVIFAPLRLLTRHWSVCMAIFSKSTKLLQIQEHILWASVLVPGKIVKVQNLVHGIAFYKENLSKQSLNDEHSSNSPEDCFFFIIDETWWGLFQNSKIRSLFSLSWVCVKCLTWLFRFVSHRAKLAWGHEGSNLCLTWLGISILKVHFLWHEIACN